MTPVPVALGPHADPALEDAIVRGGGHCAPIEEARALIWNAGPDRFPATLPESVRWVQLFSAGVEEWFSAGIIARHPEVEWTSAAGAFAATVAEHSLALLLAGVRSLPDQITATTWRQQEFFGRVGTLRGARVGILGAGGIGRALVPMLTAVGASVVAVNRSGTPVPGAEVTLPADRTGEMWDRIDHVVIAAPATEDTRHLVGATELDKLGPRSWVINVARGSLVDTDALVTALRDGTIGGAGLDVTDPEPLPEGHPLWSLPNAIITPHCSNPPAVRPQAYADHVATNVTRFVAGEPLVARIDAGAGY
ncbi:D-isomer specific 2-hydroxyacid dehydrogenase family protein [Rhodococcus sp. NPDC003318]|uniref:D-isomer specific 2-hydroxyacid dehydrogenase family protein n=1 Tax=Rhodococcus sp. NPDC003318 TaxID=3364503 RepID=UPI0036758C94